VERIDFADLVAKNRRWTWVLLLASFVLLALVGVTISWSVGGGLVGVIAGVVVALALTVFAYAGSDKLALAATRAREADPNQFGQLHNLVEQMALAAGIPKPKVYVVHDPAPNAFATGKSPRSASVAVTTGLLERLNRDELEGVIAHELAHIRNYDIRVMTVAVATAGSVAVLTDIFWRLMFFGAAGRRRGSDNGRGGNPLAIVALVVVAIFAPIAAALLKAAISRKREALADASAVAYTRYPTGLRRALEKLDADTTVVQHVSHATSHLWIESPDDRVNVKGGAKFNEMFNTHPPLRERINILRSMEGLPAYEGPEPEVLADLERRSQRRTIDPATSAAAVTTIAPPTAASSMQLDSLGREPAAAASIDGHAPAGWYVDPSGMPRTLRYWDGSQWTKHTAYR
jgi:heat shock protein HtpX